MASVPTRDKAGRPVIAVTGIGVVTSLGIGKDDNWSKLSAGVSGVRRISRFPVDGLRTTIAGTVDAAYSDYMPPADLTTRIAFLAAEEAVAQSRIGSKNHFPGPLFIAPPPLELEWHYREVLDEAAASQGDANYPDLVRAARQPQFSTVFSSAKGSTVAERLADHFGTEGSPVSLNTACASGATGIQLGVEAIRRGECQAVLAVGADGSITPELLVRFSLLSALSTHNDPPEQASRPFSKNRDGFVIAEGAAALVLEDIDHARARGARILGIVEGCGEKAELVSSHAIEPRRQADRRLHAQCARRCGRRPRRCRLHQRTRHLDAGKRQDGISRRLDGVW